MCHADCVGALTEKMSRKILVQTLIWVTFLSKWGDNGIDKMRRIYWWALRLMNDLTDRPQFQARKEIVRRGSCFQSHIQLGSHCYFEQSKIGVIGLLLDHVMTNICCQKQRLHHECLENETYAGWNKKKKLTILVYSVKGYAKDGLWIHYKLDD